MKDNKKADDKSTDAEEQVVASSESEGKAEANADENSELDALKEDLEKANDKYLRLYSEFENFRKRTSKEKLELMKAAGETTIVSLLPIVDDLERAIKSNEEASDIEAVKEGISLIYNKLNSILLAQGVEVMEAAGKDFNVDEHEAITNIPSPSEELKGKVVEEVEKGYLLNGKVIRFAKVIVGN